MSGAGFILAINLFVAGLFAVAFALVAVTNKSDRVARWFALAYVFGIVYLLFEFVLPLQTAPQLAYAGGFAAFLGAVTAVTIGIARRYQHKLSWPLLGLVCAVSVAASWFAFDLGRESILRMYRLSGALRLDAGAGRPDHLPLEAPAGHGRGAAGAVLAERPAFPGQAARWRWRPAGPGRRRSNTSAPTTRSIRSRWARCCRWARAC